MSNLLRSVFDDDCTVRVGSEGTTGKGERGGFAQESTGFGGRCAGEDAAETVERSPGSDVAVDWVVGDGESDELEMDLGIVSVEGNEDDEGNSP